MVALLLVWGVLRQAPGFSERRLRHMLENRGFSDIRLKVSSVSPFRLALRKVELKKGGVEMSGTNVYIRFSPMEIIKGKVDTIYLEKAIIEVNLDDVRAGETADLLSEMSPEFSSSLNKLIMPDGELVFIRSGYRKMLPFSGIFLTNSEGMAEITFSAGLREESLSITGNLERATQNGDFNYIVELEDLDEWLELLRPYFEQALPEGSNITLFSFSGEGKFEIEAGKPTAFALVGSFESGDGIMKDGLLVNEAIHIGIRKEKEFDFIEAAVSGQAEMLDYRSLSLEPFEYILHLGEDRVLSGELSETRFSQGEGASGLVEVFLEIDLGPPDEAEEMAQISLNFREVDFRGKQLESFYIEAEGDWDSLDVTIPDLKLLGNPGREVKFEGIEEKYQLSSVDPAEDKTAQKVEISAVDLGDLRIEGIEAAFEVDEMGRVRVTVLSGSLLRGRVECDAFEFDPGNPEFTLTMQFSGIELSEVVKKVPGFEGEASGLLKGQLRIQVGEKGVILEGGGFELEEGGGAAGIRFSPTGELTGGLARNSAEYLEMEEIEKSLVNLSLESLSLELFGSPESPDPVILKISGKSDLGEGQNNVAFTLKRRETVGKISKWSQQIGSIFLFESRDDSP